MRKERDELLQWDIETRQQIIDLLAEAQKEWDLRLVAEERSTTLEQRAKLDVEMIAWLCTERVKLHHTVERLCLKHGVAYGEHDQAIRECNKAQQRISSLQAELETVRAQKLEVEGATTRLAIDLAKVRSLLQVESNELDILKVALGVFYDDL